MRKSLFAVTCALSLFACQNPSQQSIADILASFKDAEVTIPSDLVMKIHGDEPADSSLLAKPLRMIVYLNAKGCESCKTRGLLPVYQFILESTPFKQFGVVIILNPAHIEASEHFLENILFRHTVFYDLNGSFERLNPHLPRNERFHTFLLDENNKVLLVGNPVNNAKLKKLYFAALGKQHGKGLNASPRVR